MSKKLVVKVWHVGNRYNDHWEKINRSKIALFLGFLPVILFPLLQKELVDRGIINFTVLFLLIVPVGVFLVLITDKALKYFNIDW